jgi:hypothetical protein
LCSCLFISCGPAFAVEKNIIKNDQVIVQYEKPLRTVAEEIIRIYPSVKQELENTFNSGINFRPTVRIMKGSKTFQSSAGNNLVVAVAISENDLIIIDNSKMKSHPFSLEVTLKHELSHLFLHHLVKEGNLPKWFNEGISQWVSSGMTEIIMGENKDLLKQATLSGRFIRLRDLAYGFPEDEKYLLLAYQESKSIVDFIDNEFGPDGIIRILTYLKSGNNIDAAVLKALSIPVYELEKKWHTYLRNKYTWFTYLSSHLYQVLFSLAALASIYGFIMFFIRKKRYQDEEEPEEEE